MRHIAIKKFFSGFVVLIAAMTGLVISGTTAIAESYQPSCGGDQIPNPEYEADGGFHPRCVDTLQPNVPGAYGPDGYTPCVGDTASKMSPFCSDPNGSY
jgi:hypothetical protein